MGDQKTLTYSSGTRPKTRKPMRWTEADLQDIDPARIKDQSGPTRGAGDTGRVTPTLPDESAIQRRVVRWAWSHDDERLHLLTHYPNEGKVLEYGVQRGYPDLFLPVPVFAAGAFRCYHGYWLELKRPGNDVTESQYEKLRQLHRAGYAVDVAWSVGQAQFSIKNYLYDPSSFLSGW